MQHSHLAAAVRIIRATNQQTRHYFRDAALQIPEFLLSSMYQASFIRTHIRKNRFSSGAILPACFVSTRAECCPHSLNLPMRHRVRQRGSRTAMGMPMEARQSRGYTETGFPPVGGVMRHTAENLCAAILLDRGPTDLLLESKPMDWSLPTTVN